MLAVIFHQDGTYGQDSPKQDYDVEVRYNLDTLWTGKVEGHWRHRGWVALVDQFVKERMAEDESLNQGQ